jgi:hypothetical protein
MKLHDMKVKGKLIVDNSIFWKVIKLKLKYLNNFNEKITDLNML